MDSLKCIGIHLQGSKYNNRGNLLFSSVDSFINKYKQSYLSKSSNNKLKNMEGSFNINLKKNKLKLDSPIHEKNEKLLVNQSSFYKNQLNNSYNLDSNLDSANIETIDNENEINNIKIEIKNINCKNKMIDCYQFKENERLEKKNNIINSDIRKKINSARRSEFTSHKKIFKNNEKETTPRRQNSQSNLFLKNFSSIYNSLNITNTANLVQNNKEDNNIKNNLNKRANKRMVKRHPKIVSTIIENEDINTKYNNNFYNAGILSQRNIMNKKNNIFNQSKNKITN